MNEIMKLYQSRPLTYKGPWKEWMDYTPNDFVIHYLESHRLFVPLICTMPHHSMLWRNKYLRLFWKMELVDELFEKTGFSSTEDIYRILEEQDGLRPQNRISWENM